MRDIAVWLENLGLGKYTELFAENEIDFTVLPQLTEEDIRELGLPLGSRRKLLTAIAALSYDGDSEHISQPGNSVTPPEHQAAQAERRQLTVMFVDLVGSTALSSQLDPEDMRELILAYQNAVAGEIGRFEGHVAKFMGDGVLAYFGWPQAHEDDAERAVRAALSVTAVATRLQSPVAEPLMLRIGIATGLVVVGDLIGEGAAQEEAVVGETPNLAARLQTLAEPGAVVISAVTRRLLGGVFDLQALGPQLLKGFSAPVEAYAVVEERRTETRYQALHGGALLPMLGRQHELAQILEYWQQASQGECQVILLSGEAGIGKSRILRAVGDALAEQAHYRINYQCSPYHTDSALYPAIQQITRAANFTSNENAEARLDKLELLFGQGHTDGEKAYLALIAALLGLDSTARYGKLELTPQRQRTQTLQALIDHLMALAGKQPVLLVVEDAHWIDPTTLELIDRSLDAISQSRVLLLMTARPDFQHHFGGHPIVTRLLLNRLRRESSLGIIKRLSAGKTLPDELSDEIIRKTDGVPLFVEELTKTVLESGLLRETEDAYLLNGPLRSIDIPSSLHDSLMARLDRLQSVKEIAQLAACIGREFSYKLITAVALQADSELQVALRQLIESDLIFGRGTPPEVNYTFKHALIRDVAYQSLLRSKRQQIHGRIAKVLEERFIEQIAAEPELLAHHYTEAGLTAPAARYWQQAGQYAHERSANREALSHLTKGFEAIAKLPDSSERIEYELELQISSALVWRGVKGQAADEVKNAYSRALELCEQLDNPPQLPAVLIGLSRTGLFNVNSRQAGLTKQE